MPFLFFLFIAFMGLWLVTLPFRILFRIVFGLGGGLLRLLLAPIMFLVFGVVLVALMVAAVLAVLAPLIPVALLGLAAWAIYRLTTHRSIRAVQIRP
jgi:hypothetical protein